MPTLASARYASRRGLTRPFARPMAQQRRLSQKLSMGLTPAQAARLEGLACAEVEGLIAEPGFAALLEGYRALAAMPEDEQRRILTQLARHLLMEATALGDVPVACFILLQERRGQDPARVLADRVVASGRRATAPPPPLAMPGGTPRPAYPSDDPGARALQRVESRLRDELALEHAAVHAAVAEDGVGGPAPSSPAAPGLDGAADQPMQDTVPSLVDAPAEPRHDQEVSRPARRRPPRPCPTPLLSEGQRLAIEAAGPGRPMVRDESPTPHAQGP